MKRISINKNILFVFFIIGFGFVGLLNIFSSGGLLYSEIKSSIQVELFATDENSKELVNEAFSQSLQLSNIARVERSDNIIIFQNTNFETVNSEISNIISGKEGINYEINEESPVFDSAHTINSTFTLSLIVIVISSLGLLYILSRPKEEISFSVSLKSVILFVFNSLVHFIVCLSFISVLSRAYYIKSFEINILIISSIFSSFIYVLFVLSNKNILIKNDFEDFRLKLREESIKYLSPIIIASLALVFGLSIGLGTNFVITGLILIIGLLTPIFINIFSTNLYFITQIEVFEQFRVVKSSDSIVETEKSNQGTINKESKPNSTKNKKSWNKRFKKKKK